ncbi:branched-chain amino acid transport system II carrier protein [Zobellella sp. CGMCC 1.18722]|uniref:Branched-chain amino acid transport system carrier protein n=1 Tax=Zobellella iuensis TaxID=2803811 RepID=A0ABS1QPY3_9GAMM|nr:branched-chain amino acid transport system II carrier protein [Zobellella iuensis]MBL1376925.1 branched-chain amino acid transport system II carrier protein [Zobellella iuensis]
MRLAVNRSLSTFDIMGLGFMTFAFFLGAGNIIFPPLAGYLAGENLTSAMFGFLITAVGLPLAGLVAAALAGGGLPTMGRYLPPLVVTVMACAIFIIIGPAFAAPRTGLVAFEMGIRPFLDNPGQASLTLYTLVFFGVALLLSLSQGRLLEAVGKLLTPVLLVLLVVLAIAVFVNPQGSQPEVAEAYLSQPFVKGFIEGYNTMDTFASLLFAILILDVLRKKGVTDAKAQSRYLTLAALIAAAGLGFVYVSLFILGGTSLGVVESASNGGEIISAYVLALFGTPGLWILAGIVTLACLTTAVGLISSCADYFHNLTGKGSYRRWVVLIALACMLVANVGLNTLISLSIPILVALYPVAIALVLATYLRPLMKSPVFAFRLIIAVSFVFGLLDGMQAAGLNMSLFGFLPLFGVGMAWVLPTAVAALAGLVIGKAREEALA